MKSTQKFSVCFDLIRSLLFSVFSLLKKRNGSQNVSIEKSFNTESLNITTIHNLLKNKGTFYLNAHTRDISYFVGNRERGYLFSLPCRFQQCCRQSFQFPIRILKNFSNNDIETVLCSPVSTPNPPNDVVMQDVGIFHWHSNLHYNETQLYFNHFASKPLRGKRLLAVEKQKKMLYWGESEQDSGRREMAIDVAFKVICLKLGCM